MAGSHSKRNSLRVPDSVGALASAKPSKRRFHDHIGDVSPSYCPTTAISPLRPRNAGMPVALPRLRSWTVGYRHRYVEYRANRRRPEPAPVPFLPLQGRWLEQAGFAIGAHVRVLVAPGRLVLEVAERS